MIHECEDWNKLMELKTVHISSGGIVSAYQWGIMEDNPDLYFRFCPFCGEEINDP